MKKLQISLILIILLLVSPMFAKSTIEKIYLESFNSIFSGTKNEDEKSKEFSKYLNSLTNIELVDALKSISSSKNVPQNQKVDFVVYTLFAPIAKRFEDKQFRTQLMVELTKKETNPALILVSLELLETNIRKANDQQEITSFDSILLKLVNNKGLPEYLRKKAASDVGSTHDNEYNKRIIFSLLTNENRYVVNGASLSLKKYLISDIPKVDKAEMVKRLIASIQGKNNLKEFKNVIFTLGYSKHELAKDYLLSLLNFKANEDTELQEMIARSLSSFNDVDVVKAIFNSYRVNGKQIDFGKELLLGSVINKHPKILIELKSQKSEDDKIVFLQAVRYMRKNNKMYKNDVKSLLYDISPIVRLEAVDSFRFIASITEEKEIFKEMLTSEKSVAIRNRIQFYIGLKSQ